MDSIDELINEVNKNFGTDIKRDTLFEEAEAFFNDVGKWIEREKEIIGDECLSLIVTLHNYPYFYVVANKYTVHFWLPVNYGFKVLDTKSDPFTFLNDKPENKIALDTGFWMCNCKTNFLRHAVLLECPKCKCNINNPKKGKYIGSFIKKIDR